MLYLCWKFLVLKNIILIDDDYWKSLLPITFTRPVGDIRLGILTLGDKWKLILKGDCVSYITQDHLTEKYPPMVKEDNLLINSAYLPTEKLASYIQNLKFNEALMNGEELISARLNKNQFDKLIVNNEADAMKAIDISKEENCLKQLRHPYQIFAFNSDEIKRDFDLITKGKTSQPLSPSNTVIGKHSVFVEENCSVECCMFNTHEGPVYIGKNSIIMEGSMIRGPFAMGANSVIKMGAKIYAGTTLGPGCKVGGEVQNVVFQANSNKAHDGYLGNSVIGEWCNIGAGTDNSNLKNNYEEVKLWSYVAESFQKTGLQFCGLILGDHSKIAIGVTINTGTVVGVSANIFGSGFPRNFVPSFSWGGHSGFKTYDVKKAIETAERVMIRRGIELSEVDKKILEYTYHESASYRTWEK